MHSRGKLKFAVSFAVAALAVAAPLVAGQIRGEIKSIDRASSQAVIHDEESKKDVTVNLASLTKPSSSRLGKNVDLLLDLKPGVKVVVNEGGGRLERRDRREHAQGAAGRSSRSSGTTSPTTCSSRCCCSSTSGSWCRSSRWNSSSPT